MPDFKSIERIDLSGQYVVVSGGTQGIGAAIALLCARLGANVAIIGRNAALGNDLVGKLSPEGKDKLAKNIFIQADLAPVSGMKEAAGRVKAWVGEKGVDYLFLCQGEAPTQSSTTTITEDGVTRYFSLRVLSRFVIPYELYQIGAMPKGTVVSLAAAGKGLDKVDLDNIEGRGLGFVWSMGHSATVHDIVTAEFNIRYPSLRTLHVYPGLVDTNFMNNTSDVPASIRWTWAFFMLFPYIKRSPEQYAPIAFWEAASEEAKKTGAFYWDDNGRPAKHSKAADDAAVRGKVWEKMLDWTKAAH